MRKEKIASKNSGKIIRVVLKTILFIILFVLVIFLLLLTPPVQEFLTAKVQNYLQKKLNTKIAIGRISFGLSGNVGLHDIYLEDKNHDTLLSGGSIRGNLAYLKLFSNEVKLNDIELDDITANIKRGLPDTIFNYQFIVDAFVPASSATDTTSSSSMKFDINKITLDNVNLSYTDVVTGSNIVTHIGESIVHIDKLDLSSQNFSIPLITMNNSSARVKQIQPLVSSPVQTHQRHICCTF